MRHLILLALLLTACEVPKDAKVSLAPTPIEDSPEIQPIVEEPLPTVAPTPEPSVEPTPTATPTVAPIPTPTPSPTPVPQVCNDPNYPLVGVWQNMDPAKPEDILEIKSDCTYTSAPCDIIDQPWNSMFNNPNWAGSNGGDTTYTVAYHGTDYLYCYPFPGDMAQDTNPRLRGWGYIDANHVQINFHFRYGYQVYVRVQE